MRVRLLILLGVAVAVGVTMVRGPSWVFAMSLFALAINLPSLFRALPHRAPRRGEEVALVVHQEPGADEEHVRALRATHTNGGRRTPEKRP